jgi:hypothetical protein
MPLPNISVDCVVRGSDALGECPIWDDTALLLRWVGIGAAARIDAADAPDLSCARKPRDMTRKPGR